MVYTNNFSSNAAELILEVSTDSYSIDNNSSVLKCVLKLKKLKAYNSYNLTGGAKLSMTINGTVLYSANTFDIRNVSVGSTITLADKTITINHNADGTKTVAVAANFTSGVSLGNASINDTFTCVSIPRAAKITSAPNFNDEENPTITYSNPAGDAVSALEACISLTGEKDDIKYRPVNITGSSYTFTLTEDEREILRQGVLNGSDSKTVIFYLRTTMGTNIYHETLYRTLKIINAEPVLTPSAHSITNNELTGNINTFIKNENIISVTANAQAQKGSTITSIKISAGDKSVITDSGTLYNIETPNIVFTATDNRGLTTTKTITLSMVNYFPITCSLKGKIELLGETTAGITLTIEGDYFNGGFGKENNYLELHYEIQADDNTAPDRVEITDTPTFSDGRFSLTTVIGEDFNYQKGYTIRIYAEDWIVSQYSNSITLKAIPVFDWSETDFNFNVPIRFKNQEMKDFIVEQGTSEIWTYRLWNSGIAECWGTIAPAAHSITNAWGAIYTKDNAIPRQYYPFQFIADPVVSMTLHNPTGNCWAYTGTPGGVSQTPAFGLARGTSGSATVGARIMAIGRWK